MTLQRCNGRGVGGLWILPRHSSKTGIDEDRTYLYEQTPVRIYM